MDKAALVRSIALRSGAMGVVSGGVMGSLYTLGQGLASILSHISAQGYDLISLLEATLTTLLSIGPLF